MAKIGVMGGTFNPIHNAHLSLAQSALTEFGLDKILFVTGGNPPHKKGIPMLDAKFRHCMVKLAVADTPAFIPCDYETTLSEYSYTANTLHYLHTTHPDDALYFILGADSLNYIEDWYKPAEIMQLATLLVYDRSGFNAEQDAIPLRRKYGADIRILHAPEIDISSTEIRESIKNGENIEKWVPPAVAAFIQKYRLYQEDIDWETRLQGLMKPARFLHSLGVRDTAVNMAAQFGVDTEKARIAGLLHDCAKGLDAALQYDMCKELEVPLDKYELENPGLVHAKLGAELAKCWFGVQDSDILDAIRWHTLGRPGMSDLEKIIFIADMLEPNRSYPEVEELRKVAFADLNRGLYACVDAVIQFNTEKGKVVHPNAYALRDWIKNQI